MTNEERHEVDAACLRLMGWQEPKWDHSLGWYESKNGAITRQALVQPSRDAGLVVPLAEALRARGWLVQMIQINDGGWGVDIRRPGAEDSVIEYASALPACLALAAARAVDGDDHH